MRYVVPGNNNNDFMRASIVKFNDENNDGQKNPMTNTAIVSPQ